jgi:hypothetical protein
MSTRCVLRAPVNATVQEYATATMAVAAAKVPVFERNLADKRAKHLKGFPGWCRAAATPFQRAGSNKCHDWKMLLQWSAGYVLHDIVPVHMRRAFFGLLAVLTKILDATSDVDMDEEDSQDPVLEALKLEAVLALIDVEETFPLTDVGPITMHIIPHVVEAIFRWNSVRNFWAFFTERYVSIML